MLDNHGMVVNSLVGFLLGGPSRSLSPYMHQWATTDEVIWELSNFWLPRSNQALLPFGCSIVNGTPTFIANSANEIALFQSLFPSATSGISGLPSGLLRGRNGPPTSRFRNGLKELHGGASQIQPILPCLISSSIRLSIASKSYKMSIGSNIGMPAAKWQRVKRADPAKISKPGFTKRPTPNCFNQRGGALGIGNATNRDGWSAMFDLVSTHNKAKQTSANTRKGNIDLKIPFNLKELDLPLLKAPITTRESFNEIWIKPELRISLQNCCICCFNARPSWRLMWDVFLKV